MTDERQKPNFVNFRAKLQLINRRHSVTRRDNKLQSLVSVFISSQCQNKQGHVQRRHWSYWTSSERRVLRRTLEDIFHRQI